jgi:alpha-amylase/alpha-mannosidase (GH57 family)
MERFLCIHCHFYQPPRENPWLEAVEIQDGAYPYHDWNERITAECYGTNSSSRILDNKKRIMEIINNYARISFNVGPTLLSWLERNAPDTYSAILEADRLSTHWRSGHGAAIAQAYNHSIMPLANGRDKRTQALWGIKDFFHRFERHPEGMWLPETAVDIETLEILASLGIKFTILAPRQARRSRKMGEGHWKEAPGGSIDPSMAYACRLPSGRSITLFFYDSPISHAVAFERLLNSGQEFANRLLSGFSEKRKWPQLMHIATDGESYGHHHRFGDMALAFSLRHIETKGLARITNYGEYLELNPPTHEVEIYERTSWSCAHGVERWRADCGCNTGAHPGWNQQWRAPLFEAMNWLRDELKEPYERNASAYFKDPWAARDDYIEVILDRSEETLKRFLERHCTRPLEQPERVAAVKLLELQRHAMLMFTSCGWFFDDISGIETVQTMQYAGRAIQLADEILGNSVEYRATEALSRLGKTHEGLLGSSLKYGFIERLRGAKSNVPEYGNGALIYEKFVKPVELQTVCAHYAVSSLFEDYADKTEIYCYDIENLDYRKVQAGRTELVTGKCRVTSAITGEPGVFGFSVLHLGNHDFNCGVRRFTGDGSYHSFAEELHEAFDRGAFSDLVRLMDIHFEKHRYTLKNLFKDEQRLVLETLLRGTLDSLEASYRHIYEDNRILMGFLEETGIPIPKAFYTSAEFILNLDLKRQLQSEVNEDAIQSMLKEFKKWNASLNTVDCEFALRRSLEREMERLLEDPSDSGVLDNVERMIDVSKSLPFDIDLWRIQNIYHKMAKTCYPECGQRAGTEEASAWAERFKSVGRKLNFNLDSVLPS